MTIFEMAAVLNDAKYGLMATTTHDALAGVQILLSWPLVLIFSMGVDLDRLSSLTPLVYDIVMGIWFLTLGINWRLGPKSMAVYRHRFNQRHPYLSLPSSQLLRSQMSLTELRLL